jgi:hypothetical protein
MLGEPIGIAIAIEKRNNANFLDPDPDSDFVSLNPFYKLLRIDYDNF